MFFAESVVSSSASCAATRTCHGATWWHIERLVTGVRCWVATRVASGNSTLVWAVSTFLWKAVPLDVKSVEKASLPSCSCTGTIACTARTSSCRTKASWPRYWPCAKY